MTVPRNAIVGNPPTWKPMKMIRLLFETDEMLD